MKQVREDKNKGLAILLSGWLFSIMGFLATLNIEFKWLTEASINAFVTFVIATVMLFGAGFAVWKNTFVSKKAQKQNEELHKKGLK